MVFPNPVNELLTCKQTTGFSKYSKIQVVELSGRIISETEIVEYETEISMDLSRLSKGIYLIRLIDKKWNFFEAYY